MYFVERKYERDNMKTAIVIGASSESVYAIGIARKRGYHVIAFDGNPQAEGLSQADEAVVADIRDASQIWTRLDTKPDMILPVPIGRYLTTTGAVNDYYGLRGLSEDAAGYCTDKYRFHQKLSEQGLRDGDCLLIEQDCSVPVAIDQASVLLERERTARGTDAQMVIKPRYGSGSRGVKLVQTPEDVAAYLGDAVNEDVVLETVFPGTEYGVDAAVFGGELSLYLIREKILTPPPYRQCVGYLALDRQTEKSMYDTVYAYLQQVIQVLGINHCLLHCDLMWHQGKPMVIELSGRPSGHNLHNLFTPMATGVSMVDRYINYVESQGAQWSESNTHIRQLLIGYFDCQPCHILQVPDASVIQKQFGSRLLQYDCRIQPGELQEVRDGHTLMERGYYILEGESKEGLLQDREHLLEQVFMNCVR